VNELLAVDAWELYASGSGVIAIAVAVIAVRWHRARDPRSTRLRR
jgi:hypothetical protein